MATETMILRNAMLRYYEHSTKFSKISLDGLEITLLSFDQPAERNNVTVTFADNSKRVINLDTPVDVIIDGDPYPAFDAGI